MSGFATDTVIETVHVRLPGFFTVRIELERDGVNPEPAVSCYFELHKSDNEVVIVAPKDIFYRRTVLIDGIEQEGEED